MLRATRNASSAMRKGRLCNIGRWIVACMLFAFGAAHANEGELKKVREGLISESKEKVVLFSAPWCALCKAAKFHFTTQKIAYHEINIEGGLDSMVKFHAFGGGGVPLILVKGEQLRGFSIDVFEEFLNPESVEADAALTPAPIAQKSALKTVARK